ncbi:hypothetical protein [uncultured Kocuria sp.]|uniref:hypothetical protein n=1 Tax=uncultured Kocuria sp. TaxID=259305 RepID=UPI002604D967|nr:hypothetical protein [uncultured Kocuria sp.]
MNGDRRRDLLAAIAHAHRYGQTAFVLLYEAQLRTLDAPTIHGAPGHAEGRRLTERRPS